MRDIKLFRTFRKLLNNLFPSSAITDIKYVLLFLVVTCSKGLSNKTTVLDIPKPNLTTPIQDVTTSKPDLTTPKPDLTTPKLDSTTSKPTVQAKQSSSKLNNFLSDPAITNLLRMNAFSSFRKLALNLVFDESECARDLKLLADGLGKQQEWALSMLDATSKIQPGILQGNIYGLGSYDECININTQIEKRKIQGKYCIGNIPIPLEFILTDKMEMRSDFQISLKWAVCVPKSCSAEKLQEYLGMALAKYNFTVKFDNNQCSIKHDPEYNATDYVAISVYALVGTLMVLGTSLDVYQKINKRTSSFCPTIQAFSLYTNCKNLFKIIPAKPGGGTLYSLTGIRVLSMAWIVYGHTNFIQALYPTMNYVEGEAGSSLTDQVCGLSSSLKASGSHTTVNENKKDCDIVFLAPLVEVLAIINATKVCLAKDFHQGRIHAEINQMMILHMSHTNNLLESNRTLNYMRTMRAQFILEATACVDTFLFMSGLLVSYTILKQFKNGIKILHIPVIIFHRFIRITPAFMAMILFQISLVKYLGSGPIWEQTWRSLANTCHKYWWSSILYIQNYHKPNSYCIGPSWYLSVDMQLFCLAPFLMIFFRRFKKLTYPIIITMTIASSAIVFAVTLYYQFPVSVVIGTPAVYLLKQAKLYVPTHTRAGPWLIGMALGYFLHSNRGRKLEMSRAVVITGWILSISTLLSIIMLHYIFVQRDHEFNSILDPTFAAIHRVAWTLALVWIVISCENGYGGPVNSILSFYMFQPLARLSYCQYLVHYTFQTMMATSVRTPLYTNAFIMFYKFLSDLVMTLFLAAALFFSFESPVIIIEKILRGAGSNPKKCKDEDDHFKDINKKNFAVIDRLENTKF